MNKRARYLALGLLAAGLFVYQAGPAWDHLLLRLSLADSTPERALSVLRNHLIPLFCTILGIGVAAVRINDRRAWLLLAFLLAYAETSRESVNFAQRTDWMRLPAFWYNELAEGTWAIWLGLFALYMPDRLPLDRRHPSLKVVLIAPIAVIATLGPMQKLGSAPASDLLVWLGQSVTLIAFAFTVGVFALLGYRYIDAATLDDRRRLRLLYWGAVFSLAPSLLLLLVRNLRGELTMDFAPVPVVFVALTLTALLPLTLAYVILVHRALDVRIVIREGMVFALASRVLTFIRHSILALAGIALLVLTADQHAASPLRIVAWSLLLGLLLQPNLANRLRRWLDQSFFREENQRESALSALIEHRWTAKDGRELAELALQGLRPVLHLSSATILIEDDHIYRPAAHIGSGTPPPNEIDARLVLDICRARRGATVYIDDRNSWVHTVLPESQALLYLLDTRLLVPFARDGRILGLLSAGPKLHDLPFSASEIRLVERLAARLAIAFENCKLVEHLQQELVERQRLNSERHAAEEASRAKSAFLAHMSHELRTPLNAILGYTDILREGAEETGNQSALTDLGYIRSASRHLLTLINALLDISKIDAGKMEAFLEPVDVKLLVQDVAGIITPIMETNQNRLTCQVRPDVGIMVTDATKLRQILVNLLGNAAKFTKRGAVTLDVCRQQQDDAEVIRFEVHDTGIGMTPEQLARLFRPFEQASAAITHQFGGTGLGLALSRRLCELMNGHIRVESEPGVGTTFFVTLPARATTVTPAAAEAAGAVAAAAARA
jgi:signal transduction histidine kinase